MKNFINLQYGCVIFNGSILNESEFNSYFIYINPYYVNNGDNSFIPTLYLFNSSFFNVYYLNSVDLSFIESSPQFVFDDIPYFIPKNCYIT
jgi:hypothetical protein